MHRFLSLLLVLVSINHPIRATDHPARARVVIENGEWKLVGDLTLPDTPGKVPAVLMLNKAAGDRTAYNDLAVNLAERGIASIALDMRGHGESTNVETFVPGPDSNRDLIWDSQVDVIAALAWLRDHPRVATDRLAIVGASYSSEEAAEAGRLQGFEKAYVMLSPGSFGDESIDEIDTSGASWLLVISRNERYLKDITEETRERSRSVEVWELPGTEHASDLLGVHSDLAERIAVWLAARL